MVCQGELELREQIVHLLEQEGVHASPDQITVTTGSQAALDIVTQVLVNPGDIIVAEAPSYVGALGVFAAHEANVVHVPMDSDGLIPGELERTLTELEEAGKPVKFIYTVPNFHNPGGVCLAIERRPQIVEIARRHKVIILEDNPYGMLGFDDQTNRALYNWNPDGVIYLGSFSKIFAPDIGSVGHLPAKNSLPDLFLLMKMRYFLLRRLVNYRSLSICVPTTGLVKLRITGHVL